ncbi:unnamed protein product [Parnassius mnemosyne]|uniref:Uncharacterized protein n=1 Tax=Parnassius mnemosyne TaxID=213953 RepID=A0AAV1KYD3_9NEOP
MWASTLIWASKSSRKQIIERRCKRVSSMAFIRPNTAFTLSHDYGASAASVRRFCFTAVKKSRKNATVTTKTTKTNWDEE